MAEIDGRVELQFSQPLNRSFFLLCQTAEKLHRLTLAVKNCFLGFNFWTPPFFSHKFEMTLFFFPKKNLRLEESIDFHGRKE